MIADIIKFGVCELKTVIVSPYEYVSLYFVGMLWERPTEIPAQL